MGHGWLSGLLLLFPILGQRRDSCRLRENGPWLIHEGGWPIIRFYVSHMLLEQSLHGLDPLRFLRR
jgi:hypothetical protein